MKQDKSKTNKESKIKIIQTICIVYTFYICVHFLLMVSYIFSCMLHNFFTKEVVAEAQANLAL